MYNSIKGLHIGDIVITTHKPLSIELGPGIVNNTFNGNQYQLTEHKENIYLLSS